MDDLIVFLRARLGEDEHIALAAGSCDYYDDIDDCLPLADERNHALHQSPWRALREVEAKRAILAEYAPVAKNDGQHEPEYAYGWAEGLGMAVRALAAIYRDHPDYRQEWAP